MDLSVHGYFDRAWLVVPVAGELDMATAPRLRAELMRLVAAHPDTSTVLDLRGVGFIDSVGLGVLVGARRRVTTSGKRFVLVIEVRQRRVFELSGLDVVFEFADSVDELLTAA